MSDYLWDRTGEADPEVERLEELLGAFAHRPGRLELPPEAAAPARAPLRRLAWLAAAAALLLATLVGALVALRPLKTYEARLPARQSPPAAATSDAPDAPAHEEREERAGVEMPAGSRRRRASHARPPRDGLRRKKSAPQEASDVARVEGAGGAGASRGEVATTLGRGFSVKQQLFDALLLTSTKLKEVQRKTQGADARALDEPKRSR